MDEKSPITPASTMNGSSMYSPSGSSSYYTDNGTTNTSNISLPLSLLQELEAQDTSNNTYDTSVLLQDTTDMSPQKYDNNSSSENTSDSDDSSNTYTTANCGAYPLAAAAL